MEKLRRGWPFGLEAELEIVDDLIDGCGIFDEGNDLHLASTRRTDQWIHLVDLADHLGPAFGGHIVWLIFNDRGIRRISLCLIKRQMEARKTGNPEDFRSMIRKNEEGFLHVMKENLNPGQNNAAINILRPDGMLGGTLTGSLDGSVNRLVRVKVAKNKIEKALPIL